MYFALATCKRWDRAGPVGINQAHWGLCWERLGLVLTGVILKFFIVFEQEALHVESHGGHLVHLLPVCYFLFLFSSLLD